jgi:hypothetical protein
MKLPSRSVRPKPEKAYVEIYGETMERLARWNIIRERISLAVCQAQDALPWKRLKGLSSVPSEAILDRCNRSKSQPSESCGVVRDENADTDEAGLRFRKGCFFLGVGREKMVACSQTRTTRLQ